MSGAAEPGADPRLAAAADWFGGLQLRIVAAMEGLEREFGDVDPPREPGRFAIEPWSRTDAGGAPGGGGRMAMLRGRLFEKMGAHCSTVFGAFPPEFAKDIPGAAADPRFWAAGVSVIAHPWSPHVPTVHMNVRLVRTTKLWFGGGADLTPMLDARRVESDPDAVLFHAAMRAACARHPGVADADRFEAWCDEYFFLRHRNERRGIGGIFFDHLNSAGDSDNSAFDADFAFVRDVGDSFIAVYSDIVRRNASQPWSLREREEQCVRRGRYVEFNLLYDRGTIFGLKTGGNIASILSSMPPEARWP
ncbi:coproporphyrinogen oxidase [Roseiarcus fermentans]|uniref:coproporphyrinogen oxidase n=1 Tax=Roseiarcus fermentans TaxID=1473586 RepID=A0A366F0L0_9HYPH|nr:oxygen-dependent coproporphyrinogen oxidase [Roseiarcus fermentans]RBP08193.1 coproporphyrinogen oxidase [Roseiarcus fermentans]